ncbi:cytochrome b5-like [Cephus cinctus]|uniref:Cytochrome b5 n=1 Tax=Cephus cinctus TaxID=211228 RepID=A0AAJ7FES2_CEPCN|nr:cytochrome b5-like [Cephus cinctus]XP_015588201.1 cytochrome b5-like [Cephus cinctus]XP_015588203.1 cytochrome b5-like [Cephus cinctus]
MPETKLFTRDEVAKTDNSNETIFIVHDKVYNVTSFLNEHPGGEEILKNHMGADATEDFDDIGHSVDALELMKKYEIGELVEQEKSNVPLKQGWVAGYDSKVPEKYVNGPGLPFYLLIGGFVVILVALFLYN